MPHRLPFNGYPVSYTHLDVYKRQVPGFRGPSMFLNPNYFALMMVFVCICAVVQLVQSDHWYLYATVLVLGLTGIVMADGRAALITGAVCILLALVLLKQWRLTIILLMIAIVVIPLLLTLFPNLFIRLEGVSVSADLQHRIMIWKAAIKGFLQSPVFGQGAWMLSLIHILNIFSALFYWVKMNACIVICFLTFDMVCLLYSNIGCIEKEFLNCTKKMNMILY